MDEDTLSARKLEHINLALQSQVNKKLRDDRFYYEPMCSSHRNLDQTSLLATHFLDKLLKAPLWISSMTGGAREARKINERLAQAAHEFGIGMGLGSCRILLENEKYLNDFKLRGILGKNVPFFANLGVAQIEQILKRKEIEKVHHLVQELEADGLIIHVNPLQEWLQPEGDRFEKPAIETIEEFLDLLGKKYKLIVKEVGQGIGPAGLESLIKLPLSAIEFSAFGGTNFAKLEMLRGEINERKNFSDLSFVGHTAEEMIVFIKNIISHLGPKALCQEFIISGGINSFLDGHYFMNKLGYSCIYGQGKAFLELARSSYKELENYIQDQLKGLLFAQNFLRVKECRKLEVKE